MPFSRRVVSVAPGASRPYDAEEWRAALVIVDAGEIELEGLAGSRGRFRCGDVLWLIGLPLRELSNRGAEPAVLSAWRVSS